MELTNDFCQPNEECGCELICLKHGQSFLVEMEDGLFCKECGSDDSIDYPVITKIHRKLSVGELKLKHCLCSHHESLINNK